MLIDFRKDRTVIPAIKINDCVLERASSCKLLGLWIDDDLKWKTNTEYIVKNAAKRLYFLKILKGYNVPREDLKTFYISAIRSILKKNSCTAYTMKKKFGRSFQLKRKILAREIFLPPSQDI